MPHDEVSEFQRIRAKQLRRAMTRAETLLWRHLKAHRLARLGFRRQAPMGNYIADFVAHSCKLVVEVDGESHDFEERLRKDAQRDGWFASRGYRVMRFTNEDVMKNLEGVALAILQAAEPGAPPSLPLPRKGGGNGERTPRNEVGNGTIEAETEVLAMLSPIRLVSEAADLAARRHNGMARKGRGNEPYINHLAEVANLLATATDGADAELVAAGWLHDSIEDTDTTSKELAQIFSDRVVSLVVECTDDMSLPKAERRQKQIEDAPHKSPGAKLIKIADKISNIGARIQTDPTAEERDDLADYSDWAEKVVAGCRGGNAWLDEKFDDAVKAARSLL
ncbi:Very-short-patch-repair endonuclease [Bradyrhizobium sp. Rc2d]|nr:Very-short-patch-repair endonuclease [Bradyrhizobium sp. Rc2d]